MRQADIAEHCQVTELAFTGQPAELGFIQHRVAGLAPYHQLQGLALVGHTLQVEIGVIAPQVIGQHAGHAYRHTLVGFKLFQLDGQRTGPRPHHKLRHTHIGVAEQPQTQAGRCLRKARGKVDFTRLQGVFETGLVSEVAPGEV